MNSTKELMNTVLSRCKKSFCSTIEELRLPYTPEKVFGAFSQSPYSAFLDSGIVSEKLGRYSFIGFSPFLVMQSKAR
ncbi:MAG: hypothetical protein SVW57_02445, partial [Thermodesulfobacteriota bacterium]|nr:hypothetical protein [Thermodesulfobacteriota bacterium]